MRLLIDAGNTRIKWALERAGALHAHGESLHAHGDPLEALAPLCEIDKEVTRALVANVAGDVMRGHLERLLADHFHVPGEFAAVEARHRDLQIAYSDPSRLGVDRWLAMLAGVHRLGTPLLVADVGTAMTIDAIGANGRHHGGLIVPGARLMSESLHARTAGIRDSGAVADEAPALFARDTGAAVRAGAWHALAALVERAAARLDDDSASVSSVLLTGGDGVNLLPLVHRPAAFQADLVLKGLVLWADG